jgi:CheY-like chemotaxis protein
LPTETTVTTTRDRARTVLVVDDDAKLRDLLKQFFARHGIETLLRPDGSDIEQVLEQHDPARTAPRSAVGCADATTKPRSSC